MAPTVIEFFPKESVLCDEQNMNQLLKIGGRTLLNDLFIKSMFSVNILSSSLRIWLDLNNGLE